MLHLLYSGLGLDSSILNPDVDSIFYIISIAASVNPQGRWKIVIQWNKCTRQMEFIKSNAANNYASKLWWMWTTECMSVWLLCLQYSWSAIRPALEGSTLPSMEGCAPGGKRTDVIGRGGGRALAHVCGVFAARSRVGVSSYRGSLPLVIHTVSLHLSRSLSLCSEG